MSEIPWKEQYKHPRWQRKRLEALEAAEFSCQICGSAEDQLQVHHKRYVKGRFIWEYELDELEVLCESCHEIAHIAKDELQSILSMLSSDSLPQVIGLLAGFYGEAFNIERFSIPDQFDIEYSLCVGDVARVINDRLRSDEVRDLSKAIRTHQRDKKVDSTISISVSPQRGFCD